MTLTDNSGAAFWNGILRDHADANTIADRVAARCAVTGQPLTAAERFERESG